ncbi:uncharacterized protein SCHCODRAFT_01127222 [Schizophyllum commune H4-8]|uniref:Expressed protein n=1 Tax=Schizophyllum commune (strain H4-8 / FGSC 9210) TaxID=578458 RepID=D8Q7V1_SCHCM|nr:uncharacterized protein SCHCODRAFT_01127222 [Schizophyllum commune H4-8]KAI5891337.1 hypothetical protein SCHCODRAFT_01127222 [Schizophyllum commune H4-8]
MICKETPRCAAFRPSSRSCQPMHYLVAHADVRSLQMPFPSSSSTPQVPDRKFLGLPRYRAPGALACPSDGRSGHYPQASRARRACRLAICRPWAPRWRVSSAREGRLGPDAARKR